MFPFLYPIFQDVIASVPPHWRRGTVEEVGSRFSGAVRIYTYIFYLYFKHDYFITVLLLYYTWYILLQAMSTDSRITERTPDRIVNGKLLQVTPKKLVFNNVNVKTTKDEL